MAAFTLTINRRKRRVDADPEVPLLWVLRDLLQMTGTKYGCGAGGCGACTVHENKLAVSGEISGYHCWAQFWIDGLGWVPVDASEAWKDSTRRDYFFGAHDANRILFTRGRDIRLDPAQQGNPLNYFVYPYAELDGKPWTGIQSTFSFDDLEATVAAATSARGADE